MAPATQAGAEWVHVRPTPPTSTSPGKPPSRPFRNTPDPEGPSSLPIIGRRLPASSSFVLAATRLRALQLDPRPRDGTNQQRRGKPPQQSQPGGAKVTGHRARPPRLLTATTPMGAQTRLPGTPWARIWHDLEGIRSLGLTVPADGYSMSPCRSSAEKTTMPDRRLGAYEGSVGCGRQGAQIRLICAKFHIDGRGCLRMVAVRSFGAV